MAGLPVQEKSLVVITYRAIQNSVLNRITCPS
ncbi:hypothetical protein F383_37185 [Gossypium arboreum]|uniref:Uncharacterized protein n=1 Tax=Gossypium arboreum TaxID=29729 RepID=A0A0B0MA47_GOSAR|nr:hypothetical protein F383_37185 [Gossypium arboreum]